MPQALRAVLAEGAARRAPSRNAATWATERLNGEDGLGAIYPAMANSVMMYDVLGYAPDHPDRAIARTSVEKLLVVKDDEAYCQPCVSPVWDTALVAHALLETKDATAGSAVARGLEWLKPLQVLDVKGDWAEEKPDVRPGGWAFQYRNDHYPDLDDTAVVVMALDRAAKTGVRAGLRRGDRARRRMGGRPAKPRWRLGRVRCRQLPIIISTIFPSPIMARCSIRRPRMSRAAGWG